MRRLECLSACGGERPNGTSGRKGRHALRPPLSTIMRLRSGAVASRGIPFRRVRSASGPFSATVGTGARRSGAASRSATAHPPLFPRTASIRRYGAERLVGIPPVASAHVSGGVCRARAADRALAPLAAAPPLARWWHGFFSCGARSARLTGAMTGRKEKPCAVRDNAFSARAVAPLATNN